MATVISFAGLLVYEAYLSGLPEQTAKSNLTDKEIQKRKITSFDMAFIMVVVSAAGSSYCVISAIQGHKLAGEDFFGLFTYLSLIAVIWSGNRLYSLFNECFVKPETKISEFVLLDLMILAVVVALAHYLTWGPPLTFIGAMALLLAFLKSRKSESEGDENKVTNYGANAVILTGWAIIENFASVRAVQTRNDMFEGMLLMLMLLSFGLFAFSLLVYFYRKNSLIKIKLKNLFGWLFLLGLGYWFLAWLNGYYKIIPIKSF
ncbi:MAG: hypothetical protein WC621_05200 [Patescibacteria group bacterium]